jgi:hypothetical protein
MAACLPSNHKTLSSNPSPTKKDFLKIKLFTQLPLETSTNTQYPRKGQAGKLALHS